MNYKHLGASASLVVLGVMLSACSGGGGGGPVSTPPPAGGGGGGTPTPTPPSTTALAPSPGVSRSFKNEVTGTDYTGDPATGQVSPNTDVSGGGPNRIAFSYNAATNSYLLQAIRPTGELGVVLFQTGAAPDPALSDAKFVGYTIVDVDGTKTLRYYRYGSANPELQLTYSSFGHVVWRMPPGHLNIWDTWFAYGIETADGQLPTTGSASYSGVLYGIALNPAAGKQFNLEGTSAISLNFATKMASGQLNFTAVAGDGSRIDAGTAQFANALIFYADGYQFDSGLTGSRMGTGVIEGMLFGPNAAEVGGTFAGSLAIDAPTFDYHAQGAFAAVRN